MISLGERKVMCSKTDSSKIGQDHQLGQIARIVKTHMCVCVCVCVCVYVVKQDPWTRNGNPFQNSGLENSMDREAWRAIVHGVTKSWRQLSMHRVK